MRFIKPLDTTLIKEIASTHDLIVTVEENAIMGGAGSAVCEFLNAENIRIPVKQFGLPDRFIDHGNHEQMLKDCGLDAASLIKHINETISVFLSETLSGQKTV